MYGVGILACILGGEVGCGVIMTEAVKIDVGIAATFGGVENTLGYGSTALTFLVDGITGNIGYDKEIGIYIGKDSVISLRNSIVGSFPESILDAAVSNSQLAYDIDRKYGSETGGYVPLFSSNIFDVLLEFSWYP